MNPSKYAKTRYPVNDISRTRWSPRSFADRPVEPEKIKSILEAARWAPSSGNQQPWRFMIGFRPDGTWQKIFSTLEDGNQIWVNQVPVLLMSIGKTLSRAGTANPYYKYDTGQAVAHLTFEAMHQGLHVHQMGGFYPDLAIGNFSIPEGYKPLTVIAIGYIGEPDALPEDLRERELAVRRRKDFDEFVFSETFGQTTDLFYEK